jgi:hypothetical protein
MNRFERYEEWVTISVGMEKHIFVPVEDRGVILEVDTPQDNEYIVKSNEQ